MSSTNWQSVADNIWGEVLATVRDLRANGETLQTIAKKVGVNNCSVIGEWLAGNRQAAKAPFATLMSYAENLGINYMSYFPDNQQGQKIQPPEGNCSQVQFAKKAISILQEYCDREYNGNIRAMQTNLGMDPDVPYMNRWLKCFTGKGMVPKIDSIGPYLDKVGAVLISPWETKTAQATLAAAPADELSKAKERIQQLEKEVRELEAYKVKWEAALELEKAKGGWVKSKKESQTELRLK